MLRHLGAVYYQALQEEAAAAEVAPAADVGTELPAHPDRSGVNRGLRRRGQWRVRDVMTADVVTADRNMSYKQAAKLLTDQRVSAIPVVAGRARRDRVKARARTAAELMTSPAITIQPDASLSAAARLMNTHHMRRLPVVNAAGDLVGIVSRRDLMKVFLRPDEDITAEVSGVLAKILPEDTGQVTVGVSDGVVTLVGALDDQDLIPVAVGLTSGVDGVVTVVNRLTRQEAHSTE